MSIYKDSEKVVPQDPNEHLKNYLDYYQTLDAPKFAVLIIGAWGAGKTHLLKKLLPWEGIDSPKSIYVSLFGLKTPEDIIGAVYAAMYPNWDKVERITKSALDGAKGVGGFGFGLGGLTSPISSLASAMMRKEVDYKKIIIFDDLERADIAPKSLLGIINHYVEHHKCRVVVVAHDDKLIDEIKEAKEKIFGQTIHIQPDLESAFDAFLAEIKKTEARQFIESFRSAIENAFKNSKSNSLRILRHVVFDLARLFETLEANHLANENAVLRLVEFFSAYDFEIRALSLSQNDIINRHVSDLSRAVTALTGSQKPEKTPLDEVQDRHPDIPLRSGLLQNDVLIATLFQGKYEAEAVRASLNNSSYFAKPSALPPWRKVAGFDELDDQIVDDAITQMNSQFDRCEVNELGEMLHIFALQFMLSKHGATEYSIEAIIKKCKIYIDELLASDRLQVTHDSDSFDSMVRFSSAHGFGFWIEDSYQEPFNDVVLYLQAKLNVALEKTFVSAAQEILGLMTSDVRQFSSIISFSRDGDHKYAQLPVLKAIAPEAFVDAWLNAPKEKHTWNSIKIALQRRYEGPALNNSADGGNGWLKSEIEWLKAVIKELHKRAEAEQGLARFRIERAIPKVHFPDDDPDIA